MSSPLYTPNTPEEYKNQRSSTPPPRPQTPQELARNLARLRGEKRTAIQALRHHCETRLVQLAKEDQERNAVFGEIAFCRETQDYCAINDRRLGDPRFESVAALRALLRDFAALDFKYRLIIPELLPPEFDEFVVKEEEGGGYVVDREGRGDEDGEGERDDEKKKDDGLAEGEIFRMD